jgi:sulfite exporter TauE/SafE
MELLVAFVTGLTTGGLSCLAVQGGLLASSLARQVEQDVAGRAARGKRKSQARRDEKTRLAQPILLFLLAKLVAYTILGGLLGALGSVLQLNAVTRAVLLIAIGMFMIGNALRMLNVHPFFRIFAFEPPAFIRRYIRHSAKNDAWTTPLLLGAMTVLIPCGVTQAMMAVALAAGSPLAGAATLFAFTLGTSPVFFAIAYATLSLGARLERYFMRFVAVIVLVLGLVSIENGLNLMGSPVSASRLAQSLFQANRPALAGQVTGPLAPGEPAHRLVLEAHNDGYYPAILYAVAGAPVELAVTTNETYACSRSFVIPSLGVEKILPATGEELIDIPAQPKGTVMRFACSMGMYTGEIIFN